MLKSFFLPSNFISKQSHLRFFLFQTNKKNITKFPDFYYVTNNIQIFENSVLLFQNWFLDPCRWARFEKHIVLSCWCYFIVLLSFHNKFEFNKWTLTFISTRLFLSLFLWSKSGEFSIHPRWDWKWMTKNRASSNSTSQGC